METRFRSLAAFSFCSFHRRWRGACLGAALSLWVGCSYDLEALERAARASDAGAAATGRTRLDAASTPEELVELFPEASQDCRQCAARQCAEANEACHADPECEAVTACLAQSNDPRTHAECREAHREWFVEHMAEIDVGGPLFDCVFWRECRNQCEADRALACVERYDWPQIAHGGEVELTLLLQEALRLTPAAGARAKVCALEDLQCADPLATAKADDTGRVDLSLPASLGQFTGYIEVGGASLAPTLLVFGWPVSTHDARRMPLVSDQTLALQQRIGGREPRAGTGMVQVRVRGCSRVGTRDVHIEVKPEGEHTATWYFDDQAPTFEADETFDNGNAGVVDVPEGVVDVIGTHAKSGDEVLRWKVPVRADHLTVLVTAPTDR